MDRQRLLEAVIELAREAGREVAKIYADDSAWVETKTDGSPVTAADMAAEAIIAAGLERLTPGVAQLSEEASAPAWDTRRLWPRYWLIDPLDGTREFVARTGEFTINIALIEAGVSVLGVVDAPLLGLTYAACEGGPARRLSDMGDTEIRVRRPSSTPLLVVSRRHSGARIGRLVEIIAAHHDGVMRENLGSSLKICRVAEGSADIYPRFGPTCEWDTAAADAILRAAGGELLNSHFERLRYNSQESLINPDFIAVNGTADWQFLAGCWPQQD